MDMPRASICGGSLLKSEIRNASAGFAIIAAMDTRRSFILKAGGFAGSVLCGCSPLFGREDSYSVSILGDTHFDSPDTKLYHGLYTHSTTEERYKAHLAEHARNAAMWKERMPSLVKASGKCRRPNAAFALQLGDMVQGDCGDAATHRRMLGDAFSFIKDAYGGRLPLVTVVGNHDIRGDVEGDGALETFHSWQPPLMAKELGCPVTDTTFSFRQGPDAYIVVDFNEPNPDLSKLADLLAKCDGARYVFVISHGPFIPSGTSRWLLLGRGKRTKDRRELTRLLAKRNAIVLAGHTHTIEHYDCAFPEGRITQFVANSVWSDPKLADLYIVESGEAAYGNQVGAKARGRTPEKEISSLKAYTNEFRPFVKGYLYANGAGHYIMDVSDSGVTVSFYGGSSTAPSRLFRLRGPAINRQAT